MGEWILARHAPPAGGATAPFSPAAHYGGRDAPSRAFAVEPLRRGHWAELCLLFTSFEGGGKCAAAGIDDGLEAEEQLCELMNRAVDAAVPCAWVARHADGRVYGCRVADPEGAKTDVYVVPGCAGAQQALGFWAA